MFPTRFKSALFAISHLARRAVVLSFLILFLAGPALHAQGCSMCAANAAASGKRGMRSINRGILVLLAPTVGMMLAIGVLIYRRRE